MGGLDRRRKTNRNPRQIASLQKKPSQASLRNSNTRSAARPQASVEPCSAGGRPTRSPLRCVPRDANKTLRLRAPLYPQDAAAKLCPPSVSRLNNLLHVRRARPTSQSPCCKSRARSSPCPKKSFHHFAKPKGAANSIRRKRSPRQVRASASNGRA